VQGATTITAARSEIAMWPGIHSSGSSNMSTTAGRRDSVRKVNGR